MQRQAEHNNHHITQCSLLLSSKVAMQKGQPYLEYHISTIGVDFKMFYRERDGKRIKHQLWDTVGQVLRLSVCLSVCLRCLYLSLSVCVCLSVSVSVSYIHTQTSSQFLHLTL